MFHSFKQNMNSAESKNFIDWLKDIYKHLSLLEIEDSNTFNLDYLILTEIGVLEESSDFENLSSFFRKKISDFTFEEFLSQIMKINHQNGQCIIPKLCKTCRANNLQQALNSNNPTLIDLFCGSGGMSLGFTQAGFRTIFANDKEESCIQTYAFNHPDVEESKIVLGDIRDLASTVQEYVENEHVDIVIGGPPCQGFSNANQQPIIDDPRNKLYREYVRVVETVRPQFFVMENVEGMKRIANQVIENFNRIGYTVHYEVLNAIEFGVPQHRKRIIFIGNRIGVNNEELFNEIHANTQNSERTTLYDAIGDLPELQPLRIKNATDYESDECGRIIAENQNPNANEYISLINEHRNQYYIYNHKSRYNNDRDIEIFSRLHQGDKSDDPKIADIMPYKSRNDIFKDKYYKMIYNQPSKTMTAHMKFDCNMYIHPTQSRGLTPREAARIQSYPDDYYFKGSFTKTYMQVGNSVPPLMARRIGEVIRQYIT